MKIFDLFKKHKLGLYITDNYVQAIQLRGVGGRINIKGVGHKDLQSGIVQNGEIIQDKLLAKNINALLETLKLKSKQCAFAIPESQSYEHIFYIDSSVKNKEFISRLEKLISEYIPMPFNEIIYDYKITDYGKISAVFVVAANKNILTKYYNLLDKLCGLKPTVFEPESISLMRNIPLNFQKDTGVILIDVQSNDLRWYLIWKNYIFDCGLTERNNTSELVKNLNATSIAFNTTTKRQVNQVFVSGNKEEAYRIIEIINEGMKIKAEHITNYRINLTGNVKFSDKYKIVSGLALHGLDSHGDNNINLVIKQ